MELHYEQLFTNDTLTSSPTDYTDRFGITLPTLLVWTVKQTIQYPTYMSDFYNGDRYSLTAV